MAQNNCNNYKKSKIHPTVADIKGQNVSELSPNLIGKSYESCDQYFKTQFNLLREESVRPLVEAVNKLKQLLATEKAKSLQNSTDSEVTKADQKRKFRELVDNEVETNVYFDIKLTKPYIDFDPNYGSVLKFTFDYKLIEKIDLMVSLVVFR